MTRQLRALAALLQDSSSQYPHGGMVIDNRLITNPGDPSLSEQHTYIHAWFIGTDVYTHTWYIDTQADKTPIHIK